MSQKSSVPQAVSFVSQASKRHSHEDHEKQCQVLRTQVEKSTK
jgi:hypothetical protein